MRNALTIVALLAFAATTLAQTTSPGGSGSQGRVYQTPEPWDVHPNMSYGRVGNAETLKVKSGELFTYRLTISDKDQWKYVYSENGQVGYEIRTEEDTYLGFTRLINSGSLANTSTSHIGEAYLIDYYITAMTVSSKQIWWDRYTPTNASNPIVGLRDTTNDVINIPVEISPQ